LGSDGLSLIGRFEGAALDQPALAFIFRRSDRLGLRGNLSRGGGLARVGSRCGGSLLLRMQLRGGSLLLRMQLRGGGLLLRMQLRCCSGLLLSV
jgi:hypothetical protein